MNNYYNTVNVKTTGEQSVSLTQKLDSWGTKLIQPRQTSYDGRTYTIDPVKKEIDLDTSPEITRKLNLFDKVKVFVGLQLKKIAAFFNKEIDAKYKLIIEGADTKALFDLLQPTKKVTPYKQGGANDDAWAKCCAECCCVCCGALCKEGR